MEQTQITHRIPLLDEKGNVAKPGYCVRGLYAYDRSLIQAGKTRIKEWDFYQVSNERYTVQLCIADISLGGAAFFSLFDMQTGKRVEEMALSLFTFGKLGLEPDAEKPHKVEIKKGNNVYYTAFTGDKRVLHIDSKKVKMHIEMDVMPDLESLTMAVPFARDGYFYLNQKINSMPATGSIKTGGKEYTFTPDTAFGVLDWGRGVWPHKCSWYWGNGTTWLPDGKLFGFEIGWGFGDMSAATENTLFYDGRAHKIEEVFLQKDEKDWLAPWVFTSSDGRFEMTMTPFFDNYTSSRVLVVGNRCHQVFGKWNGTATLNDGTVLQIKDMIAFCEFSDNRW